MPCSEARIVSLKISSTRTTQKTARGAHHSPKNAHTNSKNNYTLQSDDGCASLKACLVTETPTERLAKKNTHQIKRNFVK